MSSKVWKGQDLTLEGSGSAAEFPFTSKFDYNCIAQLEYFGECKNAKKDSERCHYIEKYVYNCIGFPETMLVAQNRIMADCTDISISIDGSYILITANNGDFTEANVNDLLYLKTPTQSLMNAKIVKKISDNQVALMVSDYPLIVAEPNAIINIDDCIIQLEHDLTKDYNKRRWDRRALYLFA